MEARYLTDLEWRICHAVNIYVYRNGRDGEQPILVHIPPSKKKNMRTVMNVVQERVKYPVGYAKFLYKMDGTRIKDPCELEMYNNYVVASNFEKHFKCAAYGRKRSPLLVLNRESKHVRVLKLQNQNYYEWLLKKKNVGEERPPYIYPAIYSNENYGPQDLPLGQMGNYHPPNVEAPGCCYPRVDGGNKTYRVDGQNKYVVNTVTVDVTPDLAGMNVPRERRSHRHGNKRHSKYRGKFLEQTPSDMLNANVLTADSASQEGASVVTSETEEQLKIAKKIRASKHKKTKSHRVHMVTSEEYHEKQCVNVIESTTTQSQTSEDTRKLQKSMRKAKREKERLMFTEPSAPPPPPAQFRDNTDYNNNAQQQVIRQHPDTHCYKEEILKYVDRAIHNSNGSVAPTQKTFYYSPEKLAEINSCGNIQQFELAFTQPQQTGNPAGQWTLIQQQPHQQQMFQQVYAIESQPTTVYPVQTLDPSSINSQRPQPQSEVINSYPPPPQHPPVIQNIQLPPSFQNMHNPVPVMHAISSQPIFHQPNPQPQCVVIPNNTALAPTQQQIQPPQMPANVNMTSSPQLLTLQNHNNSQSQLQQVYQLGIVQQPNPQTCIQVDAKAMRQYVDNQKLLENRYSPVVNPFEGQKEELQQQGHRVHRQEKHRTSRYKQRHHSDQTESELDIPFTPLKTYRLNNNQMPPPNYIRNQNDNDSYDRCQNPCRQKPERLPVKVKSRNVAIQMGYPGASARSVRGANFPESHAGSSIDIPFLQDRRNLIFNPRDYSNLSLMERTPRSGRGLYERFLTPSKDRTLRRGNNFGSSYSDQYVNLRSSRNHRYPISVNSLIRPEHLVVDKPSEPNLDELVTIPPPNEFRELEAVHFSRHNNPRHQSNMFSRRNNAYYCTNNNNERSESTSQYMHSRYP
ncbi:hypothetical protein Ocin01_09801 [Orchesella cincta]|uniref:Doublecortin domain-containing protein n=1 Tax=Orchesella cincta TaxID=48709 RepID=A0A1D2MUV4_ORCCI|nr:hypothetical protein Ocin01_09801 [Orchesella cincta]